MKFKIVKRTNPLGDVKYIAYVKKYFLFFPYWASIHYNNYGGGNQVQLAGYDQEYNSLEGAEQAIQKYKDWKKTDFKIEIVTSRN